MTNVTRRITTGTIRAIGGAGLALALATTTAQAIPFYTVAAYPVSSFSGGIAGFSSGSFRPAQTFTALRSGELQDISVALSQNGPLLPHNVVVEFRDVAGGMPTSSILASGNISGSLLAGVQPGAPVMLSADFSSYHISLVSGSTYAFSLRTDDAGYAFACGFGAYPGGSMFDSTDSGINWSAQSSYDINFQVTAVPEPASLLLLGAGLGWVGLTAWRRRT